MRERQPLFEIEAELAASEVVAAASGVLRGLRAKAGDRLPVGATLAWIVGEDEPFDPDLQAVAGELRALLSPAATSSPIMCPPMRRFGRTWSAGAGAGLNRRWLARGESGRADRLRSWIRPPISPVVCVRWSGACRPSIGARGRSAGARRFAVRRRGDALPALTAAVAVCSRRRGSRRRTSSASSARRRSCGGADDRRPAYFARLVAGAGLARRSRTRRLMAGFIAPASCGRARSEPPPWMRELVADPAALGSALVNTTLRQRATAGLVEEADSSHGRDIVSRWRATG